ncbi:MAG: GatB/YqeY domain-containing protein [Candidatus Eremiobacteraeota bacterium]|nr:GatB/YqeY domain-containing protein [Candidatus Eremiobacteraeota bacterium]NNM93110.1 GatB/YqeY domain-containing protein [Candidatus Eremiobacteraeota bacterium]
MATFKERIAEDLKTAMKAREQLRVDTLRSALSGFTYKRSEAGVDLTESQELEVIGRQVKQRIDAASEFRKAGREELAAKEDAEREILVAYLPAQRSRDEVVAIVAAAIAALPESGRNQGAVMKAVMPQLKGLADGNLVREIVAEALASHGT